MKYKKLMSLVEMVLILLVSLCILKNLENVKVPQNHVNSEYINRA